MLNINFNLSMNNLLNNRFKDFMVDESVPIYENPHGFSNGHGCNWGEGFGYGSGDGDGEGDGDGHVTA